MSTAFVALGDFEYLAANSRKAKATKGSTIYLKHRAEEIRLLKDNLIRKPEKGEVRGSTSPFKAPVTKDVKPEEVMKSSVPASGGVTVPVETEIRPPFKKRK